MGRSQGYVNAHYLKTAADLFAPIKRRSYEMMQVRTGHLILDVGCGTGIDALALAELAGTGGKVVGVDHDENMIDAARKGAAQAGLNETLDFHIGDAASLPFKNGWFDSCRAERVFMHLADADTALGEMVRVVKKHGWIVIAETDWASISCDTDEIDTERQLARFRAEKVLRNGYAGRRLFRQFKSNQLTNISVDIFPLHTDDMDLFRFLAQHDTVEQQARAAGALSQDKLNAWRSDLEQRKHAASFFGSINIIMAAGRKP